jgi:hypothetical protein
MTHVFDSLAAALTGRVLDLVLPPLITAIATMLVAVLAKQLQKIGLQVTAEQTAQMKTTVRDAIVAVEEQARHAPMTSDTKRAIAVEIVKRELPKADEAAIQQHITATLPLVRAQLTPATPGTFGR